MKDIVIMDLLTIQSSVESSDEHSLPNRVAVIECVKIVDGVITEEFFSEIINPGEAYLTALRSLTGEENSQLAKRGPLSMVVDKLTAFIAGSILVVGSGHESLSALDSELTYAGGSKEVSTIVDSLYHLPSSITNAKGDSSHLTNVREQARAVVEAYNHLYDRERAKLLRTTATSSPKKLNQDAQQKALEHIASVLQLEDGNVVKKHRLQLAEQMLFFKKSSVVVEPATTAPTSPGLLQSIFGDWGSS